VLCQSISSRWSAHFLHAVVVSLSIFFRASPRQALTYRRDARVACRAGGEVAVVVAAGVERTEAVIEVTAAAVAVVVVAAAAAVAVAVVAVLVLGPLEVPGVAALPKKTSGEDGVGEVEVAEEHRPRRTHEAQHLPRRVQHQRLPIPTTMTTRTQTRTMLSDIIVDLSILVALFISAFFFLASMTRCMRRQIAKCNFFFLLQ
jgi:hypothetical protein